MFDNFSNVVRAEVICKITVTWNIIKHDVGLFANFDTAKFF